MAKLQEEVDKLIITDGDFNIPLLVKDTLGRQKISNV